MFLLHVMIMIHHTKAGVSNKYTTTCFNTILS